MMQKKEKKIKNIGEIQKVNAVCYYLIGKCIETNATKMVILQENVSKKGKNLGDWGITIKKIK